MKHQALIVLSFICFLISYSIQIKTNAIPTLLEQSDQLYKSGNLRQAFELLQKNFLNNLSNIDSNLMLRAGNIMLATGNQAYLKGDVFLAYEIFNVLTKLFPKSFAVHQNFGLAAAEVNKIDEAIKAYTIALTIKPDNPDLHFCLSTALLAAGNLKEGFNEYEWRWKRSDNQPSLKNVNIPVWNNEPLLGKSILLRAEGALGDTIQFMRYAQCIKNMNAHVIAHVPASLEFLFKECPSIDRVITSFTTLSSAPIDYQISVMSLPALLQTSESTIPDCTGYLRPSKEKSNLWRSYFEKKQGFKIGICWQADSSNDAQRPPVAQRSVPLELFQTLAQIPGVTLYCLQKNVTTPSWITHFGPDFDTQPFTDSIAIINELDLVISVDTAIAHLAGSCNKRVFTLLPWKSDWRWMLDREDTPWYTGMKLFRKQLNNQWQDIIDLIKKEIEKILAQEKRTFVTELACGKECLARNEFDQAQKRLFNAVALRPAHDDKTDLILANTLLQLGNAFFAANKNEQALTTFTKIVDISDYYAAVYHNIAFTHSERLGNFEQAVVNFDKALDLKPEDPEAHFCRALAYLSLGKLTEGFADYEYRWERHEHGSLPVHDRFPHLWHGESLRNKIILLRVEQGFGDTVHFIRYAQLLKQAGASVIAQVQKQLVKLISTCPFVDRVVALGEQLPPHDYQIPMLSLPHRLGTILETIPAPVPYLQADPDLVKQWKNYFDKDTHYKVGICWQGDSAHGKNKFMPFELYAKLTQIPGISLYSLQKIDGTHDLAQLKPDHIIHTFNDFDEKNGPFIDTAAIMKNLDLVITADTSIAHVAGALGVKTWVILPFPAEWRWLTDRLDSPWYPSLRLFRQGPDHNWVHVYNQIFIDILEKISEEEE